MNDDDLIRRLRDLGTRPVDTSLASRHLTALAEATTAGRVPRRRVTRVKVAAAFAAGLLLGGTGLASAGALPDGVQEVAHQTLGQVGIDVPPGKERYNDPAVCPGGPYRNHGEYVRTHPDDPEAGRSPCGKPVKSVTKDGSPDGPGNGTPKGRGVGKAKGQKKPKPDRAQEKGSNDPSPPPTTESTLAPANPPPTTTSTTTTSTTTTTSAPPPTTTTSTP
jgi:hypothetical protein